MWAFTIKNKITAALLLFTVLCLVMLTNLQEQRMVTRINKAVTSIYEDRVVVGNYILHLSNHTDDILSLLHESNSSTAYQRISIQLDQIDRLNQLYDKTILTDTEERNFSAFKALCLDIKTHNNANNIPKALESARKADYILEALSSIQVEEGKSKLDEVLRMTNTSNLLSYIEIVILIIIAILIQILVLSSRAVVTKKEITSNHYMN